MGVQGRSNEVVTVGPGRDRTQVMLMELAFSTQCMWE